jgi:hypothetical protein
MQSNDDGDGLPSADVLLAQVVVLLYRHGRGLEIVDRVPKYSDALCSYVYTLGATALQISAAAAQFRDAYPDMTIIYRPTLLCNHLTGTRALRFLACHQHLLALSPCTSSSKSPRQCQSGTPSQQSV